MRRAGTVVAASMVFTGWMMAPANAQSASAYSDGSGDAGVGVGIICNTSQQAERFVVLRSQGAETAAAIDAVNKEVHNKRACGVAAVAFLRDQTVKTRPMGDKLVQIVRINVVAGFNGNAWQRASAMTVQYAVIDAPGVSI